MRSLRARLFAATLAALALTLVLTIAIGAVLTRRQVDKSQATSLASRADDLQLQRRRSPTYINQDVVSGNVRIIFQPRARLRAAVPNVARASDGKTTFEGQRYLYSYRPLPVARALAAPVGEPALLRVAAVPARPAPRRRSSASRSPPGSRSSSPARSSGRSGVSRPQPGRSRSRTARRRCPRRARPRSRRSRGRSTRWPRSSPTRATQSARSCSPSATS